MLETTVSGDSRKECDEKARANGARWYGCAPEEVRLELLNVANSGETDLAGNPLALEFSATYNVYGPNEPAKFTGLKGRTKPWTEGMY